MASCRSKLIGKDRYAVNRVVLVRGHAAECVLRSAFEGTVATRNLECAHNSGYLAAGISGRDGAG